MSKKKLVWHSGPPPSVGWWPASATRCERCLRWWNGEYWSMACSRGTKIDVVERLARTRSIFDLDEIEWADRPKNWPARSHT